MSSRARTILIAAVVAIVVIAAGVIAVVATSGGSDDAAPPATSLPDDLGTVTVEGDPVVARSDGATDPAIGSKVPTITGTDYAGDPVTIAPGTDGPMMIVVMAHWCPHCNNEIPKLVEWYESGDVPEGLQVVGVSTAVNPDRDHFPPSAWVTDTMKWPWPVIADDDAQDAAVALGTSGYPYMLFVDADGNVLMRGSGEIPIDAVQEAADATAATATAT